MTWTAERLRDVIVDALDGKPLPDDYQRSIESAPAALVGEDTPTCYVVVGGVEFYVVVETL